MFAAIIETIASTLAEAFAGMAVEKGMRKAGKAQGWIALGVLALLIALLVWLGVYLVQMGVWYIGALMFAIAALFVWIVAAAWRKNRRTGSG